MSTRILSVFRLLKQVGFAVLFERDPMMCITPVVLLLSTAAYAQWDPEVIWARNGDEPTAHFGSRVFPLGDQNNDGFDDWGVSSSGQNSDDYRTTRLQFFHGGNPPAQLPYMTYLVEDDTYIDYGSSCGDLNDDSYVDWFIVRVYAAVADSKFVSVYLGGPSADTTADITFWIQWDDGLSTIEPFFGSHGNSFNFNGDEFDDLGFAYTLGVAPRNSSFSIIYGGNPMDIERDWIAHGNNGPPYLPAVIPQSFGDVNGDGFSDFVTHSIDTQDFHRNAHIYFGGTNPDTLVDIDLFEVPGTNSTLTADMNADGRADLICPDWPGGQVYFGGNEMANTPDYTLSFGCGGGPHYVSNAGDINHDGFEDVVILDNTCGRLAVYLGYFWINPNPVFSLETISDPFDLNAVSCADGIGDVNGDGIEDMAIGATSDEAGGVRGRVVILAGDSSLHVPAETHPELPQELIVSIYPNPCNALATVEFELPHGVQNAALSVFNLLGQVIKQKEISSTDTRYTLDAGSLASGIYLIQVEAKDLQQTQKLVVLK